MKRIVDMHQGQLTIHNRPQGGLEVLICLPILHDGIEEDAPPSALGKIKQTFSGHF
ncbi:osmolarity sensor protein [compost metagenome]